MNYFILRTGEVESSLVVEASGLVASRSQDGLLWTHNDHGEKNPWVYALGSDGADLGNYRT